MARATPPPPAVAAATTATPGRRLAEDHRAARVRRWPSLSAGWAAPLHCDCRVIQVTRALGPGAKLRQLAASEARDLAAVEARKLKAHHDLDRDACLPW
jgi:hypothetical protein